MPLFDALKALSDESRARLAQVLTRGQFNVQELTSILDATQSTVSHHLKVLQTAGVAKAKKEGTYSFYTLENGSNPDTAGNFARELLNKLSADQQSELAAAIRSDSARVQEVLLARQQKARQFFDAVAPRWSEVRSNSAAPLPSLNELVARIPHDGALLELGCGAGALLDKLLPRTGATFGVDSSPAMLTEAERVLGDRAAQCDLRLGYLEHLPFANDAVACAVSVLVFHLVAELTPALADIARVIAPGGKLLVVERFPQDDTAARAQFGELWHQFSLNEFTTALEKAGFSVSEVVQMEGSPECVLIEARC